MFSCCVPKSRGSGLSKTRNESPFHRFRLWLRPQPQSPCPSARRYPKSSTQVVGEELEEGLVYTISLLKVQVHRGPSQDQRWFQRKNDSALAREESRMVRTVKAGPWEKLAEHLVPAFQEGDLLYVNIFLGTYRVFTTTEQVLDRLFQRYGRNLLGSDGHGACLELKNTLSSLLGTWMDQYSEDFLQPPHSPCLRLLVAYAQEHLPGSGLEHRALVLLSEMSHAEPMGADPKAPLSGLELQMSPVRPLAPVPPPVAETGPAPEPESPPILPCTEVVPALALDTEPEASATEAPAPELKVALASPPLPPTELGSVPALELEHPTSTSSAPAQGLEAATSQSAVQAPGLEAPISPSNAPLPEPEANAAPHTWPAVDISALPTLEVQPAPSPSEARALEFEGLMPPPLSPTQVVPMPSLEIEPAPSSDVAPAAGLEEAKSPPISPVPGLVAVPPLPPVPPTQVKPAPTLELPSDYSPSAATAPEWEASLAPPPEPLPELKSAVERATPPEPSYAWPETSGDKQSAEKAELLAFPPDLVAQQLTRIDAELFKKVVPYHCLGSIWSQRNKKGKEHLAPTVRATITQFNRVTNCVITTCLGDRSMQAPDRARVVEHWIEVARECRSLHNFSSFYAVLSALQSHSIHRLKKTWNEVSRDSFSLFQTLSEIFSNVNNYSQSRELPVKMGSSKFSTLKVNPKRAQKKQQLERGAIKGAVPYLGTFLTKFVMVDCAMKEYLDGRMVNFDKRRKEYQMVAELQQLQAVCCYDALVPNEPFGAWFGAMEQLSEDDSYHLSCELEPPFPPSNKSLKAKHYTEGMKPWSKDRQVPHPEPSGSSTSHSSVQLQSGLDLSSGDAADSPPLHVAGSSSSALEIHLDHVPESKDGQETKVEWSTSTSTQSSSVVTSASGGMSSSSSSIKPRSTQTGHTPCSSRPLYDQHLGDCCIVRVSLDEDKGNVYKSILVTSQDTAATVTLKAMDKHNLLEDKPGDYKLVQIISEDRMLQKPDSVKVCEAVDPWDNHRFVLKKQTTPTDARVKNRAISALLRMKQKGPRFQKGKF